MVDLTVLPGYVAVILLFLGPPGPDMAYMLAVGLQGGRRAAVRAICGIGTGMSVYASAVVLGVSQVAAANPGLFDAVKLLGAGYLVWLGFVTIRDARGAGPGPATVNAERWYLRGLMISLANPKIMLFYLAVLPQFLGDATNIRMQMVMLSAVNVGSEVVLYGGLGVCSGVFHSRFRHSERSQSVLSHIAATVYVGLAVVIVSEVLIG